MDLKDKISKNPKIKFYITVGTVPIILMFIAFFIVIQKMGRANFEYYADIINNQFNLFSMCVYIWVTDTFILPLSPMFVFPMLIQYPWYLVIPVTGLASALGGVSLHRQVWNHVRPCSLHIPPSFLRHMHGCGSHEAQPVQG